MPNDYQLCTAHLKAIVEEWGAAAATSMFGDFHRSGIRLRENCLWEEPQGGHLTLVLFDEALKADLIQAVAEGENCCAGFLFKLRALYDPLNPRWQNAFSTFGNLSCFNKSYVFLVHIFANQLASLSPLKAWRKIMWIKDFLRKVDHQANFFSIVCFLKLCLPSDIDGGFNEAIKTMSSILSKQDFFGKKFFSRLRDELNQELLMLEPSAEGNEEIKSELNTIHQYLKVLTLPSNCCKPPLEVSLPENPLVESFLRDLPDALIFATTSGMRLSYVEREMTRQNAFLTKLNVYFQSSQINMDSVDVIKRKVTLSFPVNIPSFLLPILNLLKSLLLEELLGKWQHYVHMSFADVLTQCYQRYCENYRFGSLELLSRENYLQFCIKQWSASKMPSFISRGLVRRPSPSLWANSSEQKHAEMCDAKSALLRAWFFVGWEMLCHDVTVIMRVIQAQLAGQPQEKNRLYMEEWLEVLNESCTQIIKIVFPLEEIRIDSSNFEIFSPQNGVKDEVKSVGLTM